MKKMINKKNDYVVIALIVIVVVIVMVLTWYVLKDNPERGSFGDMFGAVNALFSGLAFVGVAYTLILQRKDLSFQRDQLIEQNKVQLKQSFESTFFELLKFQQDIINTIDLSNLHSNQELNGKDAIKEICERYKVKWKSVGTSKASELEKITTSFEDFYQDYQSEIGHYLRNFYYIIKLIDNSDVVNKRLYSNLVRAQLSNEELTLIFYNSLSDLGSEKLKPLIEKYSFFKHLPNDSIFDKSHRSFFDPLAYE